MNNLVSQLVLYGGIGENPVIKNLCEACYASEVLPVSEVHDRIYSLRTQVNTAGRMITEAAERFGFCGNAWQQYLTYLFLCDENPFTLRAEGRSLRKTDTISELAQKDFMILRNLFRYDFSPIEKMLKTSVLSGLMKYKPSGNKTNTDDHETGLLIRTLSEKVAASESADDVLRILSDFYKENGTGIYGLHTAFRIINGSGENEQIRIVPVAIDKSICLDDLIGLSLQKKMLVTNTKAFCKGKRSNDVLLYGDNGTGKSTSVKAILNEYSSQGLRLVEVNKYQFRYLPELIAMIENRNYKFVIFIDDLSFEEDEIEYKFLKSVIEGGIENRLDNILIYATSNRRHLIKEMWDDRKDMEYNGEVHHSDTIEEKISLSSRFGVTINFSKPNKQEYDTIVLELAKKEGLKMDEKTLLLEADRWELRHGGYTGRVARQFINYMAGLETK